MTEEIAETLHGYTITLPADPCPTDPREWDNLSRMVCWHNRYNLGDSHDFKDGPQDFLEHLAGLSEDDAAALWESVRVPEPTRPGLYTLESHNAYESALLDKIRARGVLMLPLILLDHSGISMSTTRAYPFNCPWDSGQVGWAYCTPEDMKNSYLMGTITPDIERRALECMEAEVTCYSAYLQGDVFGWEVHDPQGEFVDSCSGYYPEGAGPDRLDHALADARAAVEADYRARHPLFEPLLKGKAA